MVSRQASGHVPVFSRTSSFREDTFFMYCVLSVLEGPTLLGMVEVQT